VGRDGVLGADLLATDAADAELAVYVSDLPYFLRLSALLFSPGKML